MKKLFTSSNQRVLSHRFTWFVLCLALCIGNQVSAQQSKLAPFNSLSSTAWIPANFSVSQTTSTTLTSFWENGTAFPLGTGTDTPDKVVNATTTDFATAHIVLGSASIKVSDNTSANVYNAGNFAGFLIRNPDLISTGLLSGITIRTYLDGGTALETFGSSNLLAVSSSLFTGAYEVGFYTTKPFNQIEITFSGVAATYDVFYAVMRGYQAAASAPSCNTATTLTSPTYPVVVNPANTGFGGLLTIGSITNENNAVNADLTDFASLNLTAGVGTSGSFAVKNQVNDFVAGAATFVGFDLASPGLVSLSAFSSFTVATYKDGALVDSKSGNNLVSAPSSLLAGSGRTTLGFVTTQDFDEVKLTVAKLVAAGTETTSIYGAVVEPFCNAPSLDCADGTIPKNTLTPLTNPIHPVYVDGANTQIIGTACVGCSINNSQNVLDANPSNFATIVLTAGVSTTATFAVANALQTYPVNSYAGFDIQTGNLVSAAVLSTATISLYNNGALVQTGTGNAIIVGATTSLLNGVNRQTVGLVATALYDEVKISFPSFVGANLGTINIYSALFEKTCAAAILCNTSYNLSNPTFPVVIDINRTGVTGDVAAATTILNPQNVVSSDNTDFAQITNLASGLTNASIAVLDPIDTYPIGTFAGFTIRRVSGLVTATLLGRLTVNTYLDGAFQETKSASDLLDLSIALFGSTSNFLNVGFVTTKPFDEIQLTVAPLVGLDVLNGNLDVFGAFINTKTSIGGGLLCGLLTNPDFAVTNKNVPATGSVKTNDNVPAGTTYGPAPAPTSQPSGASPSLVVNTDGTYTFVSSTPGVYVYAVPVCASGSSASCTTQTLTITVLDPTINNNKPVANPDIATTIGDPTSPTAITVNIKANDGPGNAGGTLGTPTIATGPAHGTASIDLSGNLVYTPTAGYYGTDVVIYTVCETPGTSLCASTSVTITVNAPGSANTTTAADDYVSTYQSLSVTGNVKTNDTDPEGNTQTVTAQPGTVIAGKGTLVVTSTGSFTFTPVDGATGPVVFTYITTDNGSPAASATGTLHILINPFNPNPDFVVTNKSVPVTGSVKTNDVIPVGATYGPAPAPASQPSGASPSLVVNTDGTFTFSSAIPGVYVYNVPVCAPAPPTYCSTQTLTITVLDPLSTVNKPVANPDFATVTGAPSNPSPVTINVKVNDGPGNAGGTLGTPTIATGPAHGTASIDLSGNLVYTPTAGYYGTDVVIYTVCETPGTSLCASTSVTITVKAPGAPANVSINDDYVSTTGGTPATGNVLTNDLGNTLTVSNPGTTQISSGTLVLTATGSFTFTPAPGVTGPVDFTYTACDNSTPSVCGTATLHVLVNQSFPDLTPIITLPDVNFTNVSPTNSRKFTVSIFEGQNQPTSTGSVIITINIPLGYSLVYDNTITSIDVTGGSTATVDNTKWTVTSSNDTQTTLKMNAGQFIPGSGKSVLGFTITRSGASKGTANITANVNNDPTKAYDSNPLNNIYSRNINSL